MSETPKNDAPSTKAIPPAKPVGGAPKKPAKKVAKSWPSVNALLTTASITATLGGWAFFTVQEQAASTVEVAAVEAPPALVESAPPTATPVYTLTVDLPPIPTIVPRPAFDVAAAPTTSNQPALVPQPQAPQAPAAAPPIRSVTAPPPAVSAPPPAAAPAPAATTRSSR